jgi:hypothetical protein
MGRARRHQAEKNRREGLTPALDSAQKRQVQPRSLAATAATRSP